MAQRPAWTINENCVQEKLFEFAWNGGFAVSQKRKNISALHQSIYSVCQQKALEISTKSEVPLGRELSAFNLKLNDVYLECIFQGSKKFENAGPFNDLYFVEPKSAKKDERLKNSGRLISFVYTDIEFNPQKSINCQARALTLYKLMQRENTFEYLNDLDKWVQYHTQKVKYKN